MIIIRMMVPVCKDQNMTVLSDFVVYMEYN